MKQNSQAPEPSRADQVSTFEAFTELVDYSLMRELSEDPAAMTDGQDHAPREVLSGHFVPVSPTPIADPVYISHSQALFDEIGLSEALVKDEKFWRIFTGDLSGNASPLSKTGWATGYALSIYGTEYTQQCPFRTGNGYGDGRALSVLEVVSPKTGKRWEMQLKGSGPTPYCRGADGRAVLRSSIREFLAQEFMHALGVPTSRSLTLFASTSETVQRPWYSEGSTSLEPDVMVANPVAISTRVASSFLRVGQVELFARRARSGAHPDAKKELRAIVEHAIAREYRSEIDEGLDFVDQVVALAAAFRRRLVELVGHWMRVGYCQGNFNSDNCPVGGFTLDYGPFGFMDRFNPGFQPWTGGGEHFSFFNQPSAAARNFHTFCGALSHLLPEESSQRLQLLQVVEGFAPAMTKHVESVMAAKMGLNTFDQELFSTMGGLMMKSKADFTLFFRELSALPEGVSALGRSFPDELSAEAREEWDTWLVAWRKTLVQQHEGNLSGVGERMRQLNPKYTWREWLVAPAYQQAAQGDYARIHELQQVLSDPYGEQTPETEEKFYRAAPPEMRNLGGISHYSCSS